MTQPGPGESRLVKYKEIVHIRAVKKRSWIRTKMQIIAAALLCLAVGQIYGRPEAYEYGEGRAITDEALRKFYYDLYDQETDNQDNHDTHQIDIDDYFDDSIGDTAKEEHKVETPEHNFGKVKVQKKVSQKTKSTKINPILKSVGKQAIPAPASPPSSIPPVSETGGSRDPTFVLSRLLFHLSQLPQ